MVCPVDISEQKRDLITTTVTPYFLLPSFMIIIIHHDFIRCSLYLGGLCINLYQYYQCSIINHNQVLTSNDGCQNYTRGDFVSSRSSQRRMLRAQASLS